MGIGECPWIWIHSPSLEKFEALSLNSRVSLHESNEASCISLPALRTLKLSVSDQRVNVAGLFERATLPALRALDYEDTSNLHGVYWPLTQIVRLLSRSMCSIQSLRLILPPVPNLDLDFIRLFRHVPSLKELHLGRDMASISSLLLQALTLQPPSSDNNTTPLLPLLESFCVDIRSQNSTFEEKALVDMIASRRISQTVVPSLSGVACLKTVKINRYPAALVTLRKRVLKDLALFTREGFEFTFVSEADLGDL
ncbi:hypothetical protein HWV62_34345 [Athelia sp. TMB]|nr:hypothetical protein HWV62_34345 [Athelia sp. TMB]